MDIVEGAMLGPMPKKKSLDPSLNVNVRAVAKTTIDGRFDGNLSKAAVAFGVSQPYLHDVIVKESKGAGLKLVQGIAEYLRISMEDVLAGKMPGVDVPVDSHPNRTRAVEAARMIGYSKEAIERVILENIGRPDQSAEEWLDEIRHEDRKIARLSTAVAVKPNPLEERPTERKKRREKAG